MNSQRREIILISQISHEQNYKQFKLQLNDSEWFVLNPVLLFKTIDWTRFEDDVDVLNLVYSMLFDEFVIARKKILCYWPSDNYDEDCIFKLNEFCQSARIDLDVNDIKVQFVNDNKMLPEFERLWKSFILFIVESVSEDIKLNEAIEEIATLKSEDESILIFTIRENEIIRYSYLKSQVTLFEFESQFDTSKSKNRDNAILFSSFKELMSSLQNEISIKEFSANFSNSALEKQYYNAFCQNFNSFNLVQQWISNYSNN